jgi:hypothetical protein
VRWIDDANELSEAEEDKWDEETKGTGMYKDTRSGG